jgi:hypothetical protein
MAVRVCPICGSSNYTVDKSNKWLEGFASNITYVCRRCDNTFPIPLEIDEAEAENLTLAPVTDELRKATPDDIRIGSGKAWGWLQIFFPIVAFVLIIIFAVAVFSLSLFV